MKIKSKDPHKIAEVALRMAHRTTNELKKGRSPERFIEDFLYYYNEHGFIAFQSACHAFHLNFHWSGENELYAFMWRIHDAGLRRTANPYRTA